MLLKSLKRVFKQPLYVVMGVAVSFLVFFTSVLAPNATLVGKVLMAPTVSIWYKLHFFWGLVGGLQTSVIPLSAFSTIAISILLGVNIPMLVFMISKNRLSKQRIQKRGVFSSIGGTMSGFLGVGCAACGSLILTPLLASLGATGLLVILPFKGAEFGILGVMLLLVSIYVLAKKINDPLVCPIE
ncbi:MAG: hypothetical protein WDZ40_02390 [Candidatus Spechtbacterales bacterium]